MKTLITAFLATIILVACASQVAKSDKERYEKIRIELGNK